MNLLIFHSMGDLDVKGILYSTIDKIGKKNIQININKDVLSSKLCIKEILKESIQTMMQDKNYNKINKEGENVFVVLCEALTHFILTVKSIPSQRKISIKETEIDIIIPDQKTLNINSNEVLIIKFAKTGNVSQYYELIINNIQPMKQNIWVVSDLPLASETQNYVLFENEIKLNTNEIIDDFNESTNYHSFVDIIADIEDFLKNHNNKNLRFVHF